MRDLYVLIEAFRASPARYIDEMRRLVPDDLEAVMSLLEDEKRVEALRQVRDYMSHRDVRRYYDVGRLGVAGVGLAWHRTVESTFARMLLLAMRAARAEREAGRPSPDAGVAG